MQEEQFSCQSYVYGQIDNTEIKYNFAVQICVT